MLFEYSLSSTTVALEFMLQYPKVSDSARSLGAMLPHLLEEALRLSARARGAKSAYEQAAIEHFKQAFFDKFRNHIEHSVGEIQYQDGLKSVTIVEVEFDYCHEELQVEYHEKTKSGRWSKGTCTEKASYVLEMFRLKS